MVAGSCSCPESDGMGYFKHASHFPDRNTTLQPRNGHRSVEVTGLSSGGGHDGIVLYSASAAARKGVLMHTGHSQRCNCGLAS